MSAAVWFWLFYVFGVIFQVWVLWPTGPAANGVVRVRAGGYGLVMAILLFLLGYRVFGSPIQ